MSKDWSKYFANRAAQMRASEIRELLKLLAQPDIISFAGGIPDAKLFPVKAIAEASQTILSDPKRASAALQYSVSEGYEPLRQWLVEYMGKRGLSCTADNILITNGSQQALDFLGKLFISPGETVLTCSPTYLGALHAFNAYEPTYDTIPQNFDYVSKTYLRKPKFAYVMSEFENPTGKSLSLAERNALLDFVDACDVPLIEDNAYECLRYDGEALPTLMSLAAQRAGGIENAKAIYCGTFSKSIVPALRVGWIVAPKPVIEKLVLINQASSLHVSTFNQMVMHEVASSIIDEHSKIIRAAYKRRRDGMLQALEAQMPEGVAWTKPEGGMFIWVTLPAHMDAAALLQDAIEDARVAFVPGAAFYPDRSGTNTLRLSFSLHEPDVTEQGISRLGQLISAALKKEGLPKDRQIVNKK